MPTEKHRVVGAISGEPGRKGGATPTNHVAQEIRRHHTARLYRAVAYHTSYLSAGEFVLAMNVPAGVCHGTNRVCAHSIPVGMRMGLEMPSATTNISG